MTIVKSDGVDIHYDVRGAGPLVMLVAGTGYSGFTWTPELLDQLAQDFRVITFDHRGTGDSSRETAPRYTTDVFGADALAVLRAVDGGPAHLVGHSMGGRVAQKIYLQDPSAVRSLLLAASGVGAERPIEFDRVGIPVGATQQLIEAGYQQYICDKHRQNFFTDAFINAHRDEVEWLDDAYLKTGPSLSDYLRHVQARQAHTTFAQFADITVPVNILVGSADVHGSASHFDGAQQMRRLLPSATYTEIDGAKHGVFWENRDRMVDIIGQFVGATDA